MGSRLEANSSAVQKRIEQHKFTDEAGEEYEPSKFGGFNDYFRRKKIKLQNRDVARREANAEKPKIFRGVVAHVNGYTQPSLNDLHDLIVNYGGGFMQYLDGKTTVTHVIASSLTPKKKIEFRKYRIVKPAWVVDSIQAGRLLPWDRYRVVDEGVNQSVLGLRDGSVISQTNTQRSGYREQTDTSWYTGQVKDAARKLDKKAQLDLQPSGGQLSPRESVQQAAEQDEVHDSFADSVLDDFEMNNMIDPTTNEEQEMMGFTQDMDQRPRAEAQAYGATYDTEDSATIDLDVGQVLDDFEEPKETFKVTTPTKQRREKFDTQADDTIRIPDPEVDHEKNQQASPPPTNDECVQGDSGPVPDPRSPSKRALTAEEHNAILLSDPKVWKSTVVNPGFLKQYYEESRLHHLSTWKAELKSQMQALAREQSSSQQARRKRPPGARRYIFHVDFDSFFSAVSLKSRPEWVDKPAVVAHGSGSGSEIASCNYPARNFGVKNGMWMKAAQELCPDLKVLPYDFKAYEEASRGFYDVVLNSGGIVQSVSVDEALIDLSVACIVISGSDGKGTSEGSVYREQAKAEELAREMRSEIKAKTGCEVSIGIGGNILLAKVALRKAKPAGQFLMKPDAALDILGSLTVQELPGVAYHIGGKLEEIGIKYVKDIREVTKEKLMNTLGPKTGEKLWEYSRGIDRIGVGDQVIRKSVSAEVNWGVRFVNQEQADEFVKCLCEEVERRLLNEAVKGRQLTMKIMRKSPDSPLDPPKHLGHGKCDVHNKSVVLGIPTYDHKILTREAISIMKGYGFPPGELRGIGIQITKLEPLKKQAPTLTGNQRPLQFKKLLKPQPENLEDNTNSPPKIEKFAKHPAAAFSKMQAGDEMAPLLNTSGTQFILPTQADPRILAELPEDIRRQLTKKEEPETPSKSNSRQPKLNLISKRDSPSPAPADNAIPTASQLDQETLAALPDDIRAEILGHYHKSPQKPSRQALLPQSPHKNRTIKLSTKTTPTKPKSGPLGGRGRGRPRKDAYKSTSSLTQANFVSRAGGDEASASTSKDDEIAPGFLAALPESIRQELLEQQQREYLKKRGIGLAAQRRKKLRAPPTPYVPRTVEIQPRPHRPSFTSQKLTALPELREAISAWYGEFQDEEPNDEDVRALATYLDKVILEEKDMSKAVSVVKWLEWVVGQDEDVLLYWNKALDTIRSSVQAAVKRRGLGNVTF